jgi:hypothetical protein
LGELGRAIGHGPQFAPVYIVSGLPHEAHRSQHGFGGNVTEETGEMSFGIEQQPAAMHWQIFLPTKSSCPAP